MPLWLRKRFFRETDSRESYRIGDLVGSRASVLFDIMPPMVIGQLPQFQMMPGVTSIGRDIYVLHTMIFWVCVALIGCVFFMMIAAMLRHRSSKENKAVSFHSSLKVEIFWALIPFLILVLMIIPATLVMVRMDNDAKADINIRVIGYPSKWKYQYLDQGIRLVSHFAMPDLESQLNKKHEKYEKHQKQKLCLDVDVSKVKPLVVPIRKKIHFSIQQGAMPGSVYEVWARIEKPGIYRSQYTNTKLSSIDPDLMPMVVVAKTQKDFNQWVTEQRN